MDATGADFMMSVNSIGSKLGANAAAIQLPIGSENTFRGIIDIIERRQYIFGNDQGTDIKESEIDEQYLDEVEQLRNTLIEKLCDYDDELMELFLEGKEITVDKIKNNQKSCFDFRIFPGIMWLSL